MTVNNPTKPRRFAAATLLVASAGAIAASIIGPTSVANAFPAHLYPVKGYADCVKNAEAISVPGHDGNALKASCCAPMGGFMFGPLGNETCVTDGVAAGDMTKTPGAVTAVGHGPDPADSSIDSPRWRPGSSNSGARRSSYSK